MSIKWLLCLCMIYCILLIKCDGDGKKVSVVLQELYCNPSFLNSSYLEKLTKQFLQHQVQFVIVNDTDSCENDVFIIPKIVNEIKTSESVAVIGFVDKSFCDFLQNLAMHYHKIYISYNCPLISEKYNKPIQEDIQDAIVTALEYFGWTRIFVITFERGGWWNDIGLHLETRFNNGTSFIMFPIISSNHFIKRQLSTFLKYNNNNSNVWTNIILICIPNRLSLFENVLQVLNELKIKNPVMIFDFPNHPITNLTIPFYNMSDHNFTSNDSTITGLSDPYENLRNNLMLFGAKIDDRIIQVTDYIFETAMKMMDREMDININFTIMDLQWTSISNLSKNNYCNHISSVTFENCTKFNITVLTNNWLKDKIRNNDINYQEDPIIFFGLSNDVIFVMIFSLIIFIVLIVFVLSLKKQYTKRKMLKGPCKILLTPEDIILPQISEPRKLEEGIEVMLCCWLQQLQEYGGPEVEKPDLIKGSCDSIKSTFPVRHTNSFSSGSKITLPNDIRARYNGDMVQLKDIPLHGNSFEVRNKSLEILTAMHSLRHENLNPLIGLLYDPVRPSLVWEYCSRGSLEDVLVQDEIKLDWSFRLSLLTDLVRGMKYLHSSIYRVHGSLSSRNCVIDARWVLKITDYGLSELYESQNIAVPVRSARDLLWTAPELLRNEVLQRRGTQQGDVYSFAIIMQEVIVRGEPFCMLSLSPEEIIEKVKKPPPLIRPSVSKGAAPPEAINIMRQCWAEQPEKRPHFDAIFDLFKTLNHGRKVNFVDTMFQMLEKYSNNLEDLIRERTEQLDMEKKKTEQLLNRMLPSSVADKLKLGMPVDPEEFSEVTIYFSDIVGFTTISAYSTPFEVVDLLNDLYTSFDATINAYNVYKVETIGDAYMVVGGLPVRIHDHSDQVATMALDLLHQSGKFKIRHLPSTPLRLRIGLHTGPCCAGVVGLTMPRYCLFGDTVNTASRLESTGSPGRIHISETTKQKLDKVGKYHLEYRGETELKGKGKMNTYWLLGKEGFDKLLPIPPPVTDNHGLHEDLIRASRLEGPRSPYHRFSSESTISSDTNYPIVNPQKPLLVQKSLDSGLFTHEDNFPLGWKKKWPTKRQMTFDAPERSDHYKHVKSSTVDSSRSLSTEAGWKESNTNCSEKTLDFLGVPFVNKTYIGQPTSKPQLRQSKGVNENNLSDAYNYYRCLNDKSSKVIPKILKRQYSMDTVDDVILKINERHGTLSKHSSPNKELNKISEKFNNEV